MMVDEMCLYAAWGLPPLAGLTATAAVRWPVAWRQAAVVVACDVQRRW